MPNMDGVVLRQQILRERPGIKVLLMSGHAQDSGAIGPFLHKPFQLEELGMYSVRRSTGHASDACFLTWLMAIRYPCPGTPAVADILQAVRSGKVI